MEEKNNPLSPHLQIYKWQISSLLSITHRIVGVINTLAIIVICFWSLSLLLGADSYLVINNFFQNTNVNYINHFIYISSDAVYSDTKYRISENSETKPSSIHGIMHLHRENLLRIFIPNKKLLILRPTLIYGRNDTHNSYGPNRFMRLAIKNKDIKLFGRGEELRDHIHISDVIKIIYLSLKSNKFGIYNVVTGKIISFKKLAEKSIEKSLSKSKIIFTKRYGSMPHLGLRQFNNTRLKKEFKNHKFSNIDQKLKDFL